MSSMYIPQEAYSASNCDWERDIWSEDFPGMTTRRVLLVDDDTDQLAFFGEFLKTMNYGVVAAQNASEAMTKLRTSHVDIIVCDAMMPGESGFSFIRRVRKMKPYSFVPSILLTASRKDLEMSSLAHGADMFCRKAEAQKLLIAQIEFLIG